MAQGEDTGIAQLASHDGMLFFGGALRKTLPPNATAASAAAQAPCGCSDAPPRDTGSLTPPFLVTTPCFWQAQFGNCNASFMQARLLLLLPLPLPLLLLGGLLPAHLPLPTCFLF